MDYGETWGPGSGGFIIVAVFDFGAVLSAPSYGKELERAAKLREMNCQSWALIRIYGKSWLVVWIF